MANDNSRNLKRPPVVVVMGHVDHGKTTLLDYVRKTAIAAKEAGGITQSIGAYEIIHSPSESRTNADSPPHQNLVWGQAQTDAEKIQRNSTSSQRNSAESDFATGHKITFIDTPGHEAFSKMRARGAKIADIAILIVAADDGVKPQTKEALKIIQEAKIPFIVAINKIDKPNADIDRVKNELTQAGILLEGYGGNVSWQAISAKTGQGVNELLDLILLTADVENLTFNPQNQARGFILEAKLESRRGIIAAAIIKDGALELGDDIASGRETGKIKILENFLGKKIEKATPSAPVLIVGFESLPKVGEEFIAGQLDKKTIPEIIKERAVKPATTAAKTDLSIFRIILKADVSGSLEALSGVMKHIPRPSNAEIEIIEESVGDISDGDVKSATATKAAIVGFKVRVAKAAENLAKSQSVKIIQSDIIYDLIKALERELSLLSKAVILGDLEVLAIFGKPQAGTIKKGLASKGSRRQIFGGKVISGEIRNNETLEIVRKDKLIGQGKIINLQKTRQDAQKVEAGNECGLLFDSEMIVNVGDHLLSK